MLAPLEVHGFLGDTIKLPCNLQLMHYETPRVKLIRWERLEPWGDSSTVAEFHWERGPSIEDPDHMQFLAAGKDQDLLDASLILTDLHPDDDANYTCEVITFPQGSGRASIWLRVFYAPQVSISLYDKGQLGHRETSLSCDARGNPEPESYNWSTTTGPLPPYAEPQGTQLLLHPSDESINTTFICCVSNTMGIAQVAMTVLLPGPSREQSLSPTALVTKLTVGIMAVFVVLGVMIYVQCFRKSCKCLLSGTFPTRLSILNLPEPQSL